MVSYNVYATPDVSNVGLALLGDVSARSIFLAQKTTK